MSQEHILHITHRIRVRFNETDALGMVWHGNYLNYFEDGREAFGRRYGLTYLDVKNQGYAMPIVKTQTKHKLPLYYGDEVIIATTFINQKAAKLVFRYDIKNKDGLCVSSGETTQVFTNIETGEMALALPDFFKQWKQKLNLYDV